MKAEISFVIIWYGYVLLLGWVSFPLVSKIFRHSPDRGFALSKTFGLFLSAYLIWITSSLGIVHYHRSTLFVILFLYALVNIFLFFVEFTCILNLIKTYIRLFLGIEGIFLIWFLACVVIRMYNPDITGAEKEADFTFLNAVLHSKTFPPQDIWFAGAHINYYYFGYVIWATVIKVTDMIVPVGFNLALATIVGTAAVGIFGLVYHFSKRVSVSLLASFLLTTLGNLDGLVQIVQRHGRPLPFDWWRSSRVIPDTINEFPYFSFLLGDLHAHFIAIPFTLLFIGLLVQLLESVRSSVSKKYILSLLSFIALFLGGTAVINTWDFPTCLILTGACILIAAWNCCWSETPMIRRILIGVAAVVWLFVLSRLLFLPFYRHFTPQLTLNNLRLVASSQRTQIQYFLVIYGLFLWGFLPFSSNKVMSFLRRHAKASRETLFVWGNCILLVLALMYICSAEQVFVIAFVLSGVFLYEFSRKTFTSAPHSFPYVLLFMAFAMLAGCEIVYIKDFYGHPLERQNTIFKFHYQAWILLSIGVPSILHEATQKQFRGHRAIARGWKAVFVLLCSASCLYPVLATYEKTNHFRGHRQGGLLYVPTLNGISYIANQHPYEYEALAWIRKNLDSDTVILEATGPPYSFFGRVATTTGRSTVLGWGNHEALWRDQTWKSIMRRTKEIEMIYESTNKANIIEILQKYYVDYVYIGKLEKQTYQAEGLKAFQKAFSVIYENDFVKIFKVPF